MKILVNYSPKDKPYLGQLAFFLKQAGLQAMSTSLTLEIGELLTKAKAMNAQAILLCNEETLQNCVPGEKPTLDSYRGTKLNFSVPVIVCNKLDHINSVAHGSWLLQQDLAKFQHIHKPNTPFDFKVLETTADFVQAQSFLNSSILIAFDIETGKFNQRDDELAAPDSLITCVSWTGLQSNGSIRSYVLPLVDFGVDHWKDDASYVKAIKLMQEINSNPVPKVMHNGLYDSVHTIRYHAEPNNWQLDTMAMAHAEFSELPKSLDFVASYCLPDYRQWKQESDAAAKSKDIKRYWAYNAQDTFYTLRIALHQLRNMPAYARRNYADKFKLVYPSMYCAFEGWLIDQDKRKQNEELAKQLMDKNREELRIMLADPNFNPGSWQQVEKYIYTIFGAKKPRIGTSKSCTDEKNLKVVGQQHPLLAMLTDRILEYKKNQKAYGTYFTFLQYNGRLLYALNPFGTETERMACQASSFWCGTQVQNIPKYAKDMLVADEGFEACEIDNSQSEARCTAYLAQEEALISALEHPTQDFYRTLGTLFFQMPYEEVDDFFRNKVLKKVVHGTNYMMGGKTFLENIGAKILYETAPKLGIKLVDIPRKNHTDELTILQMAKHLLELYHVPFPRIRKWYEEIYHEVATTHMLRSPLGYVRYFFGDITKDHNMLRSAVAHAPQNLSVSVLNKGFYRMYKELVLPSKGKFRLKAQVHDSCGFQYPKEERDIWIPKAMACLDNPVVVHGRTLRIPTEAEYGPNWKDREKYHAPSH